MRCVLTVWLLLMPLVAWSGIVGVYKVGDGRTMRLSFKDSNHIRMSMSEGRFVLISGDQVYMVRTRDNGQTVAIDMAAMGQFMQRMGLGEKVRQRIQRKAKMASQVAYESTGRTVTIAGYKGTVYKVTGPGGQTHEVVLSHQEDVVALSYAWLAFSERMARTMGVANQTIKKLMGEKIIEQHGGILRVGQYMRLKQISHKELSAGYFQLPEGTRVRGLSGLRRAR